MTPQTWTKSRYSDNTGGNCVECRTADSRVLIRDTQHRHHGHLQIPAAEWHAFLAGLHRGDLG